MAEAPLDRLACPLCLESVTETVTLGCEHCFCSACLRKHWGQSSTGKCPECNRRWSKDWPIYFALKEQTDFGEKKMRDRSEEQTGEKEVVRTKSPDDALRSSTDKDSAPSLPARGVSELKVLLQSQIKCLSAKKECVKAKEKQYLEMLQHTKRQTQHCETQIRAQFDKFHQFLKQEEERHLSALRQELEEKTQIMELELKNIQSELSSLSLSIQSAEEQLQREPTASLRECMQNLILTNVSELDPQIKSGLLIDQAKVLGNLAFRVWEKMGRMVQYSPVILDPNTADSWLRLSEDLTSVRLGHTPQQQVPLNPERFTDFAIILGSEGFSSGTHQWDVEVGDHPSWAIGLAKESVNRTSLPGDFLKDGLWSLQYRDNKYLNVVGKAVKLQQQPKKISVMVNCGHGQISFYNGEDMTPICSHKDTFTEKVFPYFSVGQAGNAKTKNIKIVHAHLKVSASLLPLTRSESVSSGSQESETKPKESELSEKVPSRKFWFLSPRESKPKTSESTEQMPFISLRRRSKLKPQTGPESSERTEKST